MNKALGYNDVSLVPNLTSYIHSRDDIKIEVELFPGVILTNPIIASPMKDVCNAAVAKEMRRLGGFGILHRFQPVDEQVKELLEVGVSDCACAVGLNDDDRFEKLYAAGCRYFCLDVANGSNITVRNNLLRRFLFDSKCYWIAGNIASFYGYRRLASIKNVSSIRCGVSGGSACSTRDATGIFNPPISLIQECDREKRYGFTTKIIADGGIKTPADFCKSLIFGADFIMLGGLIAATKDSPAKFNSQGYKMFSGSASYENQNSYREPRYIEGETIPLHYSGESIEGLMTRFSDGLKSSMSYFNARSLTEYRQNLNYVVV